MKYVVILGDGMADYPVDAFDGKTILEVADKPTIDYMAQHGEMGMVKTVQDGMKPGSDVANLSVMGYDTKKCYSGRSPLEAASIGVPLKDNDVTFRCNLVTLSDEENYEDKTMLDYSAGEITTEEAAELIKAVAKELDTDTVSYTHLLGKPKDEDDAFNMLSKLSGREHEVYTGYCVMRISDGKAVCGKVRTKVKFKDLSDDKIRGYINSGEPMDKAGAYGIQGLGSLLIEKIDGDYFNVVGLPISALADTLEDEMDIKIL